MNDYEARKQARAERYRQCAENARARWEAAHNRSDQISGMIPFGQPILVGHHSERRHRADIKRLWDLADKACQESDRAKYWQRRAEAAENSDAISRSDPEACEKIRAKIAELEAEQARHKAINAAIRKGDDAALLAMGLSETTIANLKQPDFAGRVGFPSYDLRNRNANIRRYKERLAILEREQARPEQSEALPNGATVSENAEYGSIEVRFPGRPVQSVIDELKRYGFRWAGRAKCWYIKRRSDAWLKTAREIAARA